MTELTTVAVHLQDWAVSASTAVADHCCNTLSLLSCLLLRFSSLKKWGRPTGAVPTLQMWAALQALPNMSSLNRMGIMGFADKLWERESW